MTGREQLVGAFLSLHAESAARLLESMPVEQANAVLASRRRRDCGAGGRATCSRPTPRAASKPSRPPTARCCSSGSAARNRPPCCAISGEHRQAVLAALGPQWVMAFKLLLSYPVEHGRRVGRAARAHAARRLQRGRGARTHRAQPRSRAGAHLRARPLAADCAARSAGSRCCRCQNRKNLASILEPADALWARDALATAQEHSVWERTHGGAGRSTARRSSSA